MPADDILLDCEEHMEKAIEHLKHELRSVRTGRANPAMGESVKVDYFGSPTDLRSIASINDAKLPMTPHSDGKTLRLTLPPMSQEVRLKMAGQVKGMAEDVKIRIRQAR